MVYIYRSVGSNIKKPKNVNTIEGQKQEQKVKDQKVKEVRSPNQEVLGQQGQDLN